MFTLKAAAQLFDAKAGRKGECAQIIPPPRFLRSDKISERIVELPFRLFNLLAQCMEHSRRLLPTLIAIDFDVVAHTVRRKETINRARREQPARIAIQFLRPLPCRCVVQDFRVAPPEFPGMKKGRPIDKRDDLIQGKVIEGADACKGGNRDFTAVPIDGGLALSSTIECQQRPPRRSSAMLGANLFLFQPNRLDEVVPG